MGALLREHAFRLRHDRGFWILTLTVAVLSFINVYFNAVMMEGAPRATDRAAFSFLPELILFCAIAVVTSTASAYENGGPQSRIMAGYRRSEIYSAAVISAAWQCLILAAACLIVPGALCTLVTGPFEMSALDLAAMTGLACLSACIYAAMFLFIATRVTNRARSTGGISVMICVATAILLMLAGVLISSALSEPPMTDAWDVLADGTVVDVPVVPNRAYIGGAQRTFLETMLYALPGARDLMLAGGSVPEDAWKSALWGAGILTCFWLGGIAVFRRKDLQ